MRVRPELDPDVDDQAPDGPDITVVRRGAFRDLSAPARRREGRRALDRGSPHRPASRSRLRGAKNAALLRKSPGARAMDDQARLPPAAGAIRRTSAPLSILIGKIPNPADFRAMLSGGAIPVVLGCLSSGGLFSDRLCITSRSESSCRETVFSGGRSPSSWPSCWRRPGPQRNGRPGGSAFSRSSGSPGSNWRRACRSITRRRSFGGGMPTTRMRPRCSSKAPLSPHRADFIAIAVAITLSILRAREAKNVETYGSARWASNEEIHSAGLLGPDGVILGCHAGHYLRHDGPEHVLCFAPTRSGKGVGLVVPTLLTWPGSCIVHDIKGENWTLTAGFRFAIWPRPQIRSDRRAISRLQSVAGGAARRQGSARRPEHRRHPGRSGRGARPPQSLGEDQPQPSRRRDPACPLCRARQDARRRRQLPVRSEAPSRGDAARHDVDAAPRRMQAFTPSSPPPPANS